MKISGGGSAQHRCVTKNKSKNPCGEKIRLGLIHLVSACRGRTAVRSPATSSHMYCVELALKGVLCTRLGSKGQAAWGF